MYLFVSAGKFASPNCVCICLSFNYKLLRLSVITSIPLASYVSLVILTILYIYKKNFFLILLIILLII